MRFSKISILVFLAITIGITACKKDEGNSEPEMETKYFLTSFTKEYDDEKVEYELSYNSDNLLEKIKSDEAEYKLEYGWTGKLDKIIYEEEGGTYMEEWFLYNAGGHMIEIKTYADFSKLTNNSELIEAFRKKHLSPSSFKLNRNAGLELQLLEKFWLNDDLLPETIEMVYSTNLKKGERQFSYSSSNNIKEEKVFQFISDDEQDLLRKITNEFDSKKSPVYDLNSINRFSLLAELFPFLSHSMNNLKKSTTKDYSVDDEYETEYDNEYTEQKYLDKSTSSKDEVYSFKYESKSFPKE